MRKIDERVHIEHEEHVSIFLYPGNIFLKSVHMKAQKFIISMHQIDFIKLCVSVTFLYCINSYPWKSFCILITAICVKQVDRHI